MGAHGFGKPPQHCHAYLHLRKPPLPEVFGLADGWNMPVVRHEAVLGEDADFPGVDHYVITCHLGGARARRIDNPRFGAVADRGAISLQVPGSGCSIRSEDGRPVRYAHLYCRQSLFDEVFVAMGRQRGHHPMKDFFGRNDVGCDQDILHYLARASSQDVPPTALEMDSRAYLIALAMARVAVVAPKLVGLATVKALDRRRVAEAVAFIEDRLTENPSLEDIANHVGLSAFHFARAFKAAAGESPAAYASRRQADRAREMIAHTKLPLAEIAIRTGYSSQSHMTRRLKSIFGGTPGRLRNSSV